MTLLNSSSSAAARGEKLLAAEEPELDPFVPLEDAELDELVGPEVAARTIEGELLTDEQLRALNNSDEGKNAIRTIEGWFEDCKNVMSDRRRDWRLNEAFERGRQHVFYDKKNEKVENLPRPEGQPRATVNKMRGLARTEIAKFTAQRPTADALPASNDAEDIAAARAAKQLWDSLYERLDVAARQRRTARWMSVTGLGYMKPYWDDNKWDAASKVFGDIAIDVVPPYNVFVPEVYIEDITEQPYVIHAYLLPADSAKSRYGDVLGPDWSPQGNQGGADQATEFGRIYERGSDSNVKQTLVMECWVNPGMYDEWPDGAYIVVVDKKIVDASTTGFPPGYTRYPLVKFEHILTGIYWPACVFDDAISIQREINRSTGQLIQLKNAMILNGFFYEEGSIDPENLTTKPGQAVAVYPGYKMPVPIPPPTMPQHLGEVLNRSDVHLEDISGQHASTQGKHVAGLEAATAIGQLIEQDEAYISPAIASIEKGLSDVASIAVTLFSYYATTPRVVKVVGDDQGLDVLLLKGAEIMGGTDIRMQSSSALPTSKSARQAFIIDLAKTRPDLFQGGDLLQLLEVPQLSNYLNQQMETADKNAAQRENVAFKSMAKMGDEQAAAYIDTYYADWEAKQQAGDPETVAPQQPIDPLTGMEAPPELAPAAEVPVQAPGVVPVNEWDDHAVHIYMHDLLIKSQWWQTAPKPVQAEVQKHRALHVAALQQQMAMQAAPAGPPGAAPGGAPGAPTSPTGRTEDQIMKGE